MNISNVAFCAQMKTRYISLARFSGEPYQDYHSEVWGWAC